MIREVRRVQNELKALVAERVIDDFSIDGKKSKHHRLSFLHKGQWRTIPMSLNPHNEVFTRQQIRRMTRG
jgi:hypothetical protein